MKLSDIRKEAEKTIKKLFLQVLSSSDKDLWKKALDTCDDRIYLHKLNRNLYKQKEWESVKYKLASKYGKKFIKPRLQNE